MQEQSGVHCGRDNLCVVPALRISEVVGHDRELLTAEIGGLDRPVLASLFSRSGFSYSILKTNDAGARAFDAVQSSGRADSQPCVDAALLLLHV